MCVCVCVFDVVADNRIHADHNSRCIKMALVHDMAEAIVGDITPFCGISKEEKHKREVDAITEMCALIKGSPAGTRFSSN